MLRKTGLLLLGQNDRLAGDDAARDVQPEQRDHGGAERAQSEGIGPAGEAAGQVLGPTDERRTEKPAEIAERVDPAMPAAAAPPVRNIVGIDQNGPLVP
jgi:hypothetical protein